MLAYKWLKEHGGELGTKEDCEAIEDCLWMIKACTYWVWPRGSRIFFWKFPDEWRSNVRDGIPFWQVSKPPVGYLTNMAAPYCEAELAVRLKIFKLKIQHNIEERFTNLLIPNFLFQR